MTGKGSQSARDELAVIAVEAVKSVVDEDGTVDTDNITVEKKVGGGITDSQRSTAWWSTRRGSIPTCPRRSRTQRSPCSMLP